MPELNDYNKLAKNYQQASVKPDKLFSTLPTVLKIAGNLESKIILDLGCGSGFFTNEFAKNGAKKVIGIDNSVEQINLARKNPLQNTEYILGDIFEDNLPIVDIVIASYVVNYATDTEQLTKLFQNIYTSLSKNGKLIAVVDLPEGKDLKKFGAIKNVLGEKVDGVKIEIQLFNSEEFICTLNSVYFTPNTLENTLRLVGFSDIVWHKPIVSDAGMRKFGNEFWKGYIDSPELGYISAVKIWVEK